MKDIYKSQNNKSINNKKISAISNSNNVDVPKQNELTNSHSKYSQPQQILSKEEFEEVEPKKISQNEPSVNSNRNLILLKNLKEQIDQLESEKIVISINY